MRAGPSSLQSLAAKAVHDSGGSAALPDSVSQSIPAEASLRVAVLGDASASMQVCVNSACICGAMMAAIFEADLVFFGSRAFRARSHPLPRSAAEVLEVTEEVHAQNTTSPAAALHEFYRERRPIDLFIVVTDEEENTTHDGRSAFGGRLSSDAGERGGMFFAALFERYLREVHSSAKCLFVSFLSRVTDEGAMVAALRERGISATQIKYDQQRPDLSKFEALLGTVLLEAKGIAERPPPPPPAPGA